MTPETPDTPERLAADLIDYFHGDAVAAREAVARFKVLDVAEQRRCHCPDDCGCKHPWRRNFCGCRAH